MLKCLLLRCCFLGCYADLSIVDQPHSHGDRSRRSCSASALLLLLLLPLLPLLADPSPRHTHTLSHTHSERHFLQSRPHRYLRSFASCPLRACPESRYVGPTVRVRFVFRGNRIARILNEFKLDSNRFFFVGSLNIWFNISWLWLWTKTKNTKYSLLLKLFIYTCYRCRASCCVVSVCEFPKRTFDWNSSRHSFCV